MAVTRSTCATLPPMETYKDGVMLLLPGLADNIALGDTYYPCRCWDAADAYVAENGITCPKNLRSAGLRSILIA
jgi:hypothetical protein